MRILSTVTLAGAALALVACTGPTVTPTPVTTSASTPSESVSTSAPASSSPSATESVEPTGTSGAADELISAAGGLGFTCLDGYRDQSLFLVSCEYGRSVETDGLPIGLLDVMFRADGQPQAFALRFLDQYNQSTEAGKAGSLALAQVSRDALARVSDLLLPDPEAKALQAEPYLQLSDWGQLGPLENNIFGKPEGRFQGWHAVAAGAPQLPAAATLQTRELVGIRDALKLPEACNPTMGCKLSNGMEFFFGAEAGASSTLLVAFGEADAGSSARQRNDAAVRTIEALLGTQVREAVNEYAAAKSIVTDSGMDQRTVGGLELSFGVGEFRAEPLDERWTAETPPEQTRRIADRVAEVFASETSDAAIRKALALPAGTKVTAPVGLKPMPGASARGWQYVNQIQGLWSHTWKSADGELTVTIEDDHIVDLKQG